MAGRGWVWAVGLATLSLSVGCGEDRRDDAPTWPAWPAWQGGSAGSGGAGGGFTGPRLVPWQLEAEGTEPLVLGIFDAQLQQHCRFVPDSAGQLRCVPEAPVAPQVTWYFLDAACRQRLYRVEPETLREAEQHPIAFPIWSDDECDRSRHVFAKGRLLSAPLDIFFGPDCTPTPGLDWGKDTMVAIAEVSPPESFVAGNIVDGPPLTDRLRLQRIETETGEQFDARVMDNNYGSPCTLSDTDPPSCIPPFSERRGYYADEACTQAVWRVLPCEVPTFIKSTFSQRKFGKPYTSQVWTTLPRSSCLPYVPTDPPASFYAEGDSIEPHGTFEWQPVGTGTLQVKGIANEAGQVTVVANTLAPALRYHDAAGATDCDVLWNLSGDARCVSHIRIPDARTVFSNSFSDDHCQKPAYGCAAEDCNDPSDLAVVFPPLPQTRASSVVELVPVGGLYTLDPVCKLLPDTSTAAAITLGSNIPWTNFPKIPERNPRTPPGP